MRGDQDMAGDEPKEYRTMKTATVSITKIAPKYLFLFRYLCSLIGATIVVCGPRKRKEKAG